MRKLLLFMLLLITIVACKKEEKKPAPAPTPITQPDKLWLLGGNWKSINFPGTDTVFTQNLYIKYCCDGPTGYVVYYLSYRIWKYGSSVTLPYYYNTDSLWFSNGIIGTGKKHALFVRIK